MLSFNNRLLYLKVVTGSLVIKLSVKNKLSVKLNQKSIKVDAATYQKIKFCATILNQKQSNFLSELIDNVFSIANQYYPKANVWYYPSLSSSQLTIQWSGKSNLIVGKNPDSFDDEIAQLVERTSQLRPTKRKVQANKKVIEAIA
jgi:hypothetical protein